MDLPRDLGKRIVEAAQRAASIHLQLALDLPRLDSHPVGGADHEGEAAKDGARSSSPFTAAFAAVAESEAP
jgi:hypothetical protein